MADLVFVSVTMAFIGLCVLYVRGCERLAVQVDNEVAGDAGQ